MKIFDGLAGLALLATSALAYAPAQSASLGVDFSSAPNWGESVWNLGWSFTANSNVDVVGLGNWDGGDFFEDQQIGLWNSTGNLLASVYVTGSETPVGNARWVFESIAPVALIAGQTYVVGAQGGADFTGEVGSPTFDPRITYGTDLNTYLGGTSNSPLVEPTTTEGMRYGFFGGNIELATVPEPSTWAMILLGFAGLGYMGHLQRRKARGRGEHLGAVPE